jgi:hypothetical protein
MKQPAGLVRRCLLVFIVLCGLSFSVSAQSILNRPVTFDVYRQQLNHVLEILSNKANFYFSYNSNIIKNDSLVTLTVYNKTVKQVLDLLFNEGFEFRESGNYIIIRRKPVELALVTDRTASEEKYYIITGYIVDDQTGEVISNASVYEKRQLSSAITDGNGYFKLKLKSKINTAALTVSKEFYEDTTFRIQPKYNQQISIAIMPLAISDKTITIAPYNVEAPDSIVIAVRKADSTHWLYTYRKTDSVMVEKTRMGKWFLSTWQKVQTINMKKFFVTRPYQLSLLPGLSTNGPLNSQVVNNISLNIWGGYAAGVNGVELAGWFNIDKKNVRWFQGAGWFNMVGGKVDGVQLAGLFNTVLDSVKGVQGAGITNFVKRKFVGLQMGGIYNHIGGSMTGAQLAGYGNFSRGNTIGVQLSGIYNHSGGTMNGLQGAGIGNFANRNAVGAQLAGIINVSRREMKGVQMAGIINYAKKLSGVQIGLINIADSSDGYSIGLINIILKGYHKLSLYSNEVLPFNAAFKTGTTKLYSILLAGSNPGTGRKIYSFGYGLGREFNLNHSLALNTEITAQQLYLGSWDHLNLLNRLNVHLNVKLGKYVSLFAGPAFNVYYSDQTAAIAGYKFNVSSGGAARFNSSDRVKGWIGWNAGINLF